MMERARALAGAVREALPWVALLILMGPTAMGAELGPTADKFLDKHGIATVILLAAMAWAPKMLKAHQALADSVKDFSLRDDYQRREMLGVLNVLGEDMRGVKDHLRDAKDDLRAVKDDLRAMRDQIDGDGR